MARGWFLLLVACADPGSAPTFATFVTVDNASIAVTPSGSGAGYVIKFPSTDVPGVPLPSSLTVGGQELLAGSADACGNLAAGIGVGISNVVVATAPAFNGPTSTQDDVSAGLAGPAVGSVRVSWNAPFMCGGGPNVLSGVTTFTAFPTGRIVRHDDSITPTDPQTGLTNGEACGCGPLNTISFDTFYAFAGGTDDDRSQGDVVKGCTSSATATVGVSFSPGQGGAGGANQASWIYKWQDNVDPAALAVKSMTSALQVSPPGTPCDDALAGLGAFNLKIGDEPMPVATDDDGLYRDDMDHPDPFDIVPENEPIPAGFAIVINLGDHAEITRVPPTSDGFVIVQEIPQDPSQLLLFFRDGLNAGERIHIEPK